jgi:hypothetical protein
MAPLLLLHIKGRFGLSHFQHNHPHLFKTFSITPPTFLTVKMAANIRDIINRRVIPCAKLFINFILFPYCTKFVYSSAILILQYFEAYLGVGLAPSSQTAGSSLRTICWLENDMLGNVFYSLNPPCKFDNSLTMLFGDYHLTI